MRNAFFILLFLSFPFFALGLPVQTTKLSKLEGKYVVESNVPNTSNIEIDSTVITVKFKDSLRELSSNYKAIRKNKL